MNKKTKTYVLIAVVIVIWGLLIYKIIDALSGTEDVAQVSIQTKPFNINLEKKKDTFSLKANYRDPFLGTLKQKTRPKTKRNSAPKKVTQPKEPLPPVTYSGYMTDPKNGERVFFININSQQFMLKPNETVENLKLISGNDTQVILRYGDEKLTIPISN